MGNPVTTIGALAGLLLLARLIQREARRVHASSVLPELTNDADAHLQTMIRPGVADIVLWLAAMALLVPRLIGLLM